MPAPAPTPQLYPTPRPSGGLSDAYTDILGGEPLQSNMCGNNTALNAGGVSAVFNITAGGPTGQQVIIPASFYGGNITWVRGLYSLTATPRYQAFMADFLASSSPQNQAAIPATFTASISGTTMSVTAMVGPDDSNGYLCPGMQITGGTVVPGTTITGPATGMSGMSPAHPALYTVSISQTVPSTTSLVGMVPAINNYSGGMLSTTIPVPPWVNPYNPVQAYYSYRDGTISVAGQSMEGWPQLYVSPYQGTANDGDCYLMTSLYHAFLTTRDPKYQTLANRIGAALLDAGRWNSNDIEFNIPFAAQDGEVGFYYYNAPTTPFALNNVPIGLQIQTTVNAGGPPSNYAGFGFWPTIPVTAFSAFNSLDITLIGDGSGRTLSVNLNADPLKSTAGDYYCNIALLPEDAYAQVTFSLASSDFWSGGNVVYDSGHQGYSYSGCYGSDAYRLDNFADTVRRRMIQRFIYDFSGDSTGYAGFYFGAAANSSAGTTGLNFKFYSAVNAIAAFTVKDSTGTNYTAYAQVNAGWSALSIPWLGSLGGIYPDAMTAGIMLGAATTGFSQSTFVHPAMQFSFDAVTVHSSGFISLIFSNLTLYYALLTQLSNAGIQFLLGGKFSGQDVNSVMFDAVTYDAVRTLAGVSPTVLNGCQISFPSNSLGIPYIVTFNSINFNMGILDGPTSDPARYLGLPRWTYKWNMVNGYVGYSAWRGCSGVGYLWNAGWYQSGLVNPDNGRTVSASILNFFTDAQAAYHTQFPSLTAGILMPRYGRPSWEALTTAGYIAGTWTSSTYNQWYIPEGGEWYGYYYRAFLSVAQTYYYSGSAQAKTILDGFMAWLNAMTLPSGGYWAVPSDFNTDGTVGYSYEPIYAYACIAATCIYKYWVDGDSLALLWYRRLLDTLFHNSFQTTTGQLGGIYPTAEGSGYTTTTVNFTLTGTGAVAPTASATIAGGKITHYNVLTSGSGMTSCSAAITGDGTGATGNAYLSDDYAGAFSSSHTGWEVAEIFNTYALIVNGPRAGGTVNYPLASRNIATASYAGKSLSVTASPMGMAFSPDGTQLYVVGSGVLYQYTLATGWDVSTGSYSGKSLSVTGQDATPEGLAFSTDGTRLYITGHVHDAVFQYTLSTAWDISTGTYASKTLALSGTDPKPLGIAFNPAGTSMYFAGYSNDHIYQYSLSTAWDISTGTYTGKSLWTASATDTPGGFAFSPDGTLLTMSGSYTYKNMIYQYALSTAWDISTGTYTGNSLSIAAQDSIASGIALSPTGSAFYLVGEASSKCYQYNLASIAANDLAAFTGLLAFYQRTARNTRPSMLTANWIPLHEYRVDPYHNGSAIENPMLKDTHCKGAMWTESIAPTLFASVEYGRYSGDWSWLKALYSLVIELTGTFGSTAMNVFPTFQGITWNITKTPNFNTTTHRSASGYEVRNALMQFPLWKFSLAFELLADSSSLTSDLKKLVGFFNQCQGSFAAFLYIDPADNTVTAQNFGTGNGATVSFQLQRTYGGFTEPVQNLNAAPSIYVNGVLQTLTTNYSISSTGLVTFVTAPPAAAALTWTGTYYYRVRFVNDTAEFNQFMYNLYELKKLEFIGSTMNKV